MKLNSKQKQELRKIAEKYKLKLIVLFGSLARRKEREDSDMDIGVIFKDGVKVDFNKEIDLISNFFKIFQKEIDLSVLNKANPLLLREASENAILLYGGEKDFFNFKLYAFHRYNDYLPFFKLEEKLNKKIIYNYARGQ
ncbi:nucleotidyltransferase domain-containing protein [Candidatus Falkowbacteria bacterium]|nr:nucleotidyltransferase domain-containing protein [Candidatus Falkowbacteria bacterium]